MSSVRVRGKLKSYSVSASGKLKKYLVNWNPTVKLVYQLYIEPVNWKSLGYWKIGIGKLKVILPCGVDEFCRTVISLHLTHKCRLWSFILEYSRFSTRKKNLSESKQTAGKLQTRYLLYSPKVFFECQSPHVDGRLPSPLLHLPNIARDSLKRLE